MNHSKEEVLVLTNEVPKKVCSRCGKPRYLHEYYRKRKSGDTYQSYCVYCDREYKRTRRAILQARRGVVWAMRVADIVNLTKKGDPALLSTAKKELETIIKIIDRKI